MSGDRGPRVGLWIKGAYRSGLEKRCAMWETSEGEFDDIVAMAHRELASARHKADNVIANAQSQASSLVEEAEFEARCILQKAVEQADSLRERAIRRAADELARLRDEARAEGLEEGRRAGRDEIRGELGRVLELLETLEAEREGYLEAQGEAMLDFALALAGKVVGMTRRAFPDLLRDNLKAMLADPALRGESLRIAVHPDDLDALRSLTEGEEGRRLSLLIDPDVTPGSCKIRGELLNVDLDLERRFARLADEVRDGARRLDP